MLVTVVIYEALCFDVAQGQMNGAPNKTVGHSNDVTERKEENK